MAKEETSPRFGPGQWVTIRTSGEHVKVEAWSAIAAAYRLRSRRKGLLFATDAEVDEVPVHPEEHLGKHWRRCQATGCGAPLTPALPVCPRCAAPTCTCGQCACPRATVSAARARVKAVAKAVSKKEASARKAS